MTSNAQLVLAVTSSTAVTGVAVGLVSTKNPTDSLSVDSHEIEVLGSQKVETDRRHAEEISGLIDGALTEAGATLADIKLLAVDAGPGRFTGLRVGLTTVRALSFALGLKVAASSSLEILCRGAAQKLEAEPGQTITAVIDAKRGEVFQQNFEVMNGPNLACKPLAGLEVGSPADLVKAAVGVVVGDGADTFAETYGAAGLRVETGHQLDAVALLGLVASTTAVLGSSVEPIYVRPPDAKPNIKAPRS